jgi:predicted Rossmann fold nucleotide-binding protein DprA/Smf involved in DNA uptake
MTNREFLTAIANSENLSAELVEHATNEIAKMDAANEKRKNKPSKTAVENAPIIEALINALTSDPQTAADLASVVGISTQKASSLLRQIVASGVAVSTDIKVPKRGTCKGYSLAPVEG